MTYAGGKRKMIDTDAKATALRELEEETAGAKNKIFVELFLSGFCSKLCFCILFLHSCICAHGFMLIFRMFNSFLHTVCHALNDSIQQAVGLRGSALEHVHAWRRAHTAYAWFTFTYSLLCTQ